MTEEYDSPELRALSELEDTQKETGSTLMAQMVELQAAIHVLIDLQKLSLTTSQHYDAEWLDAFCQEQLVKYRKDCLELVKQNVQIAQSLLQANKGPLN